MCGSDGRGRGAAPFSRALFTYESRTSMSSASRLPYDDETAAGAGAAAAAEDGRAARGRRVGAVEEAEAVAFFCATFFFPPALPPGCAFVISRRPRRAAGLVATAATGTPAVESVVAMASSE